MKEFSVLMWLVVKAESSQSAVAMCESLEDKCLDLYNPNLASIAIIEVKENE